MMISKALFTCPLQSQDWLKGTYSSSLLYMPWPIFEGFPSPSVSNRILAMLSNSLDRCFWTWANAQLGINLHSRFETLQCCFSGPVFCYTSASFWWKRFWWRVVFNSYLFFWGQKKKQCTHDGGRSNLQNYKHHCPCVGTKCTTKFSSSESKA